MDEIDKLESWLAPLLQRLSAGERARLAREVARDLRTENAANMRAQRGPDGEAWEPRKNKRLDDKGRVRAKRAQAMFPKLRTAQYLKAGAEGQDAVVQFLGRAQRIARVHHLGLRDRVQPGGPEYDYPARPLLGIGEGFAEKLQARILAHLAGR